MGTDPDSAHRPNAAVAARSVVREYTRGEAGLLARLRDADRNRPTVRALDGVDVTVEVGEIVGIAGPSGSGKSTLLHLLAALDTPTEGTVELDGEDVTTHSRARRARLRLERVGMVFQRFHLLPALSARANVALPLVELGYGKGERRERAEELLERVGLANRAGHHPNELSGGEQQRVAVARALATDPGLVVADEPTGELDTESGERVLELFRDVAADGRAVVLATHDEATLAATDRVVRLRDGRVVDGP